MSCWQDGEEEEEEEGSSSPGHQTVVWGGKGGGVRGLLGADVPSVSQAAAGAELTSPVSPPHPAARL